jgi:hypothetical protein
MIKVFGYLKRKPGLSPQEFADYYEDNHVPLVLSKAQMPLVYKRNYIQRGDAVNIEGDEIGFASGDVVEDDLERPRRGQAHRHLYEHRGQNDG